MGDQARTYSSYLALERFGGFLALRAPDAEALRDALAARGVWTGSRGEYLPLGPAPYLSDDQLDAAIEQLGLVLAGR